MDKDLNILLVILTGTLIMFLLVGFIIFFVVVYNRKITERENNHKLVVRSKELDVLRAIIETEDSEREKIAQNLHDEIGPLITALKMRVTSNQRELSQGTLSESQFIAQRKSLDVIMDGIQNVSHNLMPLFLIKNGLIKALKNFLNGLEGVQISFHTEINSPNQFDKQLELNLYRMTLELINNALKHDKPSLLAVELKIVENHLILSIKHDGKGISNEEFVVLAREKTGIGLSSLKARAVILDASLNYSNIDGSEITIKTPLCDGKDY